MTEIDAPIIESAPTHQGDALLALVQGGLITAEQERYGREIDSVWRELASLTIGASPHSAAIISSMLPGVLAQRLRARHQPWASHEIEKNVAPGVTRYGIVWRLANLNWPIKFVAQNSGLSEKTVLRHLRDSLDVYADFARRDQ